MHFNQIPHNLHTIAAASDCALYLTSATFIGVASLEHVIRNLSEIAPFLFGMGSLLAGAASLTLALRTTRKIEEIKVEIKTGNADTIGTLLGKTESRRIENDVEVKNRTIEEMQHLADVPVEPRRPTPPPSV